MLPACVTVSGLFFLCYAGQRPHEQHYTGFQIQSTQCQMDGQCHTSSGCREGNMAVCVVKTRRTVSRISVSG